MTTRLLMIWVMLHLSAQFARSQEKDGKDKDGKVTVEGYVRNSSNKPLGGVRVSLYGTGKADAIETTRTNADGYYKITKKIDSAYDIMYTHTQMDLAIVSLLAEDKNQQISIKMYKSGEARPAMAYHESLQAAERALFLAMAVPEGTDKKPILAQYMETSTAKLIGDEQMEALSEAPQTLRTFLKTRRTMIHDMQTKLGIK